MEEILIINTVGLGVGGMSTHMVNYIKKLKERYRFTVVVTMMYAQPVIDVLRELGCTLEMAPDRKKETFAYIRQLKKIMEKNVFSAVHVHGNSATMGLELFLAARAGIKGRIAHCHNSRCKHVVLDRCMRPFFRTLYTEAVACSDLAGNWLYGQGKFVILDNAITPRIYAYNEAVRETCRRELQISGDTVLLGNIGNINDQKNPGFLIRLLKEFQKKRKAELLWLGDGPLRDEMRQLAKRLEVADKVHFLGVRDDVAQWLWAMDVFVFPSLYEGQPFALVEAQAAGLPCLVSGSVTKSVKCLDSCVYKDLEEGISVWADTLEEMVEAGWERKDVSGMIREHGFDIDLEAGKLEKIYDKYTDRENLQAG